MFSAKNVKSIKKGVYLVVTKTGDFHSANLKLIKTFSKRGWHGIYVTLSKQYATLLFHFNKHGIPSDTFFFIDATGSRTRAASSGCTAVESPSSLTELSIAITEASNTGKYDFLFFDSLSTLLVYNAAETAEKFMHYLAMKMADLNITTVILSLDEEKSKKLIPVIAQFCDGVIKL
ncbi:MAG: ATPase domain-containing protein, partial [Candidatus Micrarchaeota archaeon]